MRTCTRIQRRRDRGWSKPERCMIVDRTSHFGNPFTIAGAMDIGYKEPEARATVIAQFSPWLRGSRAN
ncbi:DUF4326 domain-containing protein [Streptomyces sp. NPDC059224]|uniref:DUF4326 domain-containing protein n=1 Tax=Streptomyces sp. NPDC059224 TaxID=3346775 RepID=UPI003688773C